MEREELDGGDLAHPQDLRDGILHGASPDEGELIDTSFDQAEVLLRQQSGQPCDLTGISGRRVVVESHGILEVNSASSRLGKTVSACM